MRVEGFDGKTTVLPLAKVWINIGDFRFQQKDAVVESFPDDADRTDFLKLLISKVLEAF